MGPEWGRGESTLRDRRWAPWSPWGSPSPASPISVPLTLLCVCCVNGLRRTDHPSGVLPRIAETQAHLETHPTNPSRETFYKITSQCPSRVRVISQSHAEDLSQTVRGQNVSTKCKVQAWTRSQTRKWKLVEKLAAFL